MNNMEEIKLPPGYRFLEQLEEIKPGDMFITPDNGQLIPCSSTIGQRNHLRKIFVRAIEKI